MLGQRVFYLISKARTGIRDYVSNLTRKGPFADDTFLSQRAGLAHACIYIWTVSVSYCQVIVDIEMHCICKLWLTVTTSYRSWGPPECYIWQCHRAGHIDSCAAERKATGGSAISAWINPVKHAAGSWLCVLWWGAHLWQIRAGFQKGAPSSLSVRRFTWYR